VKWRAWQSPSENRRAAREGAHDPQLLDILETTVFLAAISGRDLNRKTAASEGDISGFKSCPQDHAGGHRCGV